MIVSSRDKTCYHDMSGSLSFSNCGLARGLVKISAICSFVEMCSTVIVFFTMWERKWWSLMHRCLVRGLVLWVFAILTQLILSSKVRHLTIGVDPWIGKPYDFRSSSRCIIAITSLQARKKQCTLLQLYWVQWRIVLYFSIRWGIQHRE